MKDKTSRLTVDAVFKAEPYLQKYQRETTSTADQEKILNEWLEDRLERQKSFQPRVEGSGGVEQYPDWFPVEQAPGRTERMKEQLPDEEQDVYDRLESYNEEARTIVANIKQYPQVYSVQEARGDLKATIRSIREDAIIAEWEKVLGKDYKSDIIPYIENLITTLRTFEEWYKSLSVDEKSRLLFKQFGILVPPGRDVPLGRLHPEQRQRLEEYYITTL